MTTSAGGILLRQEGGNILVAVVERTEGIEEKWAPVLRQLPKGGCHPGEGLEQTARREVLEETGFRSRILGKAGEAHWSYSRQEALWDETVHYYFMEPLSLDPQPADHEFEAVRWLTVQEAAEALSYPEERELIQGLMVTGSLRRMLLMN